MCGKEGRSIGKHPVTGHRPEKVHPIKQGNIDVHTSIILDQNRQKRENTQPDSQNYGSNNSVNRFHEIQKLSGFLQIIFGNRLIHHEDNGGAEPQFRHIENRENGFKQTVQTDIGRADLMDDYGPEYERAQNGKDSCKKTPQGVAHGILDSAGRQSNPSFVFMKSFQ